MVSLLTVGVEPNVGDELGAGVEGAGVGSRVVGFGVSSMAGGTGDGVKQTL